MELKIQSAEHIALRLLSQRSYTRRELNLKLRQRGFEQEIIDQVVAECERRHYVDDEALALSYRKQMTEKGYGARYVRMAMEKKGFTEQHIAAAFSDYDMVAEERTIAQNVLLRKAKTLGRLPDDLGKKEKLYRFLRSRGFSSSTIFEVLDATIIDLSR
jgi:regulatory protein